MLLPLLLLLRFSFNEYSVTEFMIRTFTLENYIQFFGDPYYLGIMWTTLRMASVVTALCLVIGYPVAHFIARRVTTLKSLVIMAVVLPLFVGNAVRAAGWMVMFGRDGIVNSFLTSTGLTDSALQIMYTPFAVTIGIAAVNLPIVILTIQSVIENMDQRIEEAASSLGAPNINVWFQITLPLVWPGILTATIFCFILTMNAYATPVLLGGPKFKMMAPVLADQIMQRGNIPFGAAVAFILVGTIMVLTFLFSLTSTKR